MADSNVWPLITVLASLGALGSINITLINKLPDSGVDWTIAGTYISISSRRLLALLVFRFILASYGIFILIVSTSSKSFNYFTVWSWALFCLYFVFAAIATLIHIASRPDRSTAEALGVAVSVDIRDVIFQESLAFRCRRRFARFMQLLFSTTAASALMLDIVLWTILFPTDSDPNKKAELNFFSYNQHGLNLLAVIVEMFANDVPIRAVDVVWSILWPLVYSFFTISRVARNPSTRSCITSAQSDVCQTRQAWPYFFMDTSRPFAALWYIGLAFMFFVSYCLIAVGAKCLFRLKSLRTCPNSATNNC